MTDGPRQSVPRPPLSEYEVTRKRWEARADRFLDLLERSIVSLEKIADQRAHDREKSGDLKR
jgi:hypothetical protein